MKEVVILNMVTNERVLKATKQGIEIVIKVVFSSEFDEEIITTKLAEQIKERLKVVHM